MEGLLGGQETWLQGRGWCVEGGCGVCDHTAEVFKGLGAKETRGEGNSEATRVWEDEREREGGVGRGEGGGGQGQGMCRGR